MESRTDLCNPGGSSWGPAEPLRCSQVALTPDGIHPRGMSELLDELPKLFSIIYHQSWLSREVPEDWRCQCEPIPKKGWKEDLGNSRPDPARVPSKVMEQITLTAMIGHLQDG